MEKMFELQGNFGKRKVKISGGHTQIENIEKIIESVEKIDKNYNTTSQLFDATKIAGKNHLLHATKLALESIEAKKSIANNPSIELTCWTAGLRQINKSLDRVGINPDTVEIAVITIGRDSSAVKKTQEKIFQKLQIEKDEKVIKITEKKIETLKKAFSVTENQLKVSNLEKIILEKTALLSLEK